MNHTFEALQQKISELEEDKEGLETLLEVVTEHSTDLENRIRQQNREMNIYIEQVQKITAAAIDVQHDTFEPECLSAVGERTDELGNLAQVFTQTVQTVKAHEKELLETNQSLEKLLEVCKRFVPHEYLRFLQKESIVDVKLGDHASQEMAVMFSDIRSFTTLSEGMTPQENFNFVNAYLQRISPEIRNHNGFIVKYLGDGMMAVFPHQVDDAIQAGISKLKRLREYNQKRQVNGYSPIDVGIGIHIGHMMVGIIGEYHRMQGDAFSDTVNLTARLEGLTKYYGVSLLISEQVLNQLRCPDLYHFRLLDRVVVKGRTEPITIYEVLDADPTSDLKLQTLPTYQEGMTYYQQGDFQQSQLCFEQVLKHNPADKTAQLYLERIGQLMQQSMPADWRGTWIFTQK
jgi:adenylate cyclase